MEIDAEMFKRATGQEPVQDDLERSNCKMAGRAGHFHCGWSSFLNRPNFMVASSEIERERSAAPLLT